MVDESLPGERPSGGLWKNLRLSALSTLVASAIRSCL
jgi:hypothetical protein